MGDYYQSYIASGITRVEAENIGPKVVQFLLERGIIVEELSDCVLGKDLGYPPGLNAEAILSDFENSGTSDVRELWTNGVDVSTKPELYMLGQDLSDDFECECPNCDARHAAEFFYEQCMDGLLEWEHGQNSGLVRCPQCGQETAATKWKTIPDSIVAGNLGITFWNWPDIAQEFSDELSLIVGANLVKLSSKI